jgi:hypothetical protein
MGTSIRIMAAAVALTAGITITPATGAEVTTYKAELDGKSQVPPVNTQGSGNLTATYNTVTKRLTWKGNVSGLSGEPTVAHFHGPADPGNNAPILMPAPGVKSGVFEGSATLTDEQATALIAGHTYLNIQTEAYEGGEVRGQILKVEDGCGALT